MPIITIMIEVTRTLLSPNFKILGNELSSVVLPSAANEVSVATRLVSIIMIATKTILVNNTAPRWLSLF